MDVTRIFHDRRLRTYFQTTQISRVDGNDVIEYSERTGQEYLVLLSHSKWVSILLDHIGGYPQKDKCPDFHQIIGAVDIQKFKMDRYYHKARSIYEQADRNKKVIETEPEELAMIGAISVKGYKGLNMDIEELKTDLKANKMKQILERLEATELGDRKNIFLVDLKGSKGKSKLFGWFFSSRGYQAR